MSQEERVKATVSMDNPNKIYARAKNIASTKRIHHNQETGFWLVESETTKGFYCVRYLSGEKRYVCDCPHFTYGNVTACKHIIACLFRLQAKSMLRESN